MLEQFLEAEWLGPNEPPQCTYLELRTTPRKNEHMSREQYLDAVLQEIEKYPAEASALIVSLDRRMDSETMFGMSHAYFRSRLTPPKNVLKLLSSSKKRADGSWVLTSAERLPYYSHVFCRLSSRI